MSHISQFEPIRGDSLRQVQTFSRDHVAGMTYFTKHFPSPLKRIMLIHILDVSQVGISSTHEYWMPIVQNVFGMVSW